MSKEVLSLVGLDRLMALTPGREDVVIALLDGPVATTHPSFATSRICDIRGRSPSPCADSASMTCRHGTFVAGILCAGRDSAAPGICPGCTLLVYPVFSERRSGEALPGATPRELAQAIAESLAAGARVVNVSGAIPSSAITADRELHDAFVEAARRGALIIAASGNQASVGRSPITGHPWVLTVVPYGRDLRPLASANLGRSIGRNGIGSPGENITSVDPAGGTTAMTGSSVAAPFVAGAAALLWSLVPEAEAQEVRAALAGDGRQRRTITPPLLDALAAYRTLVGNYQRRNGHGESAKSGSGSGPVSTAARVAPSWVPRR